jgi:hypothetical protein
LRIIQQAAKVFALVDKWYNTGTRLALMLFLIMPTTMLLPNLLKDGFDVFDAICHHAGKTKVTKCRKEVDLLFCH